MRFFLAAIGAATIASSPAIAQCSDAEKTRLIEFDRAWGEATTRGDRAALMAIYAEDYAGATLTGTQEKTSAVNDAVAAAERQRAGGQPAPAIVYDNYIVTCTPLSATLTHRNAVTATVNGQPQTSYSRSVHILEKRGGRWQVVGNAGHALTDAAVVLYMENDWNEAIKKRDATWYERHYADDVIDIASRTGAPQTKAQTVAMTRADKSVYDVVEISDVNARVEGNVAMVTGVFHEKGRDGEGKPFDRRSRFIDTFIRRDGRWLIWSTQGTPIP